MIKVTKIDSETFEVIVNSGSTTNHKVNLPDHYYEKLTHREVPPEILVERSFQFLLEREPNTSILRSFKLSVIGRYFPEYERTIRKMI